MGPCWGYADYWGSFSLVFCKFPVNPTFCFSLDCHIILLFQDIMQILYSFPSLFPFALHFTFVSIAHNISQAIFSISLMTNWSDICYNCRHVCSGPSSCRALACDSVPRLDEDTLRQLLADVRHGSSLTSDRQRQPVASEAPGLPLYLSYCQRSQR